MKYSGKRVFDLFTGWEYYAIYDYPMIGLFHVVSASGNVDEWVQWECEGIDAIVDDLRVRCQESLYE